MIDRGVYLSYLFFLYKINMQLNELKTTLTQIILNEISSPRATDSVQKVYNIFKDYYHEDRVDLQYFDDNKWSTLNVEEILDNFLGLSITASTIQNPLTINIQSGSTILTDIWEKDVTEDTKEDFIAWLKEEVKHKIHEEKELYFCVIVWFPNATIKNEQDQSVEIFDLFARVVINRSGLINGSPTYKRSTYPLYQIQQGYLHSHCPSMSRYDAPGIYAKWGSVCTGTGPINETTATLRSGFNEMAWAAYCWELDKIVHIESLAGVPYFRMSTLFDADSCCVDLRSINTSSNTRPGLEDFISYFLEKKLLKFSYHENSYHLGESINQYMMDISNTFIEWLNLSILNKTILKDQAIVMKNLLTTYIVKDNKLYKEDTHNNNIRFLQYIGYPILPFKKEMKTLVINDYVLDDKSITRIQLLNFYLMGQILYSILRVINYKYDQNFNRECNTEDACTLQNNRQVYYR